MIERYSIPGAVVPRGPYSHAVTVAAIDFVSSRLRFAIIGERRQ